MVVTAAPDPDAAFPLHRQQASQRSVRPLSVGGTQGVRFGSSVLVEVEETPAFPVRSLTSATAATSSQSVPIAANVPQAFSAGSSSPATRRLYVPPPQSVASTPPIVPAMSSGACFAPRVRPGVGSSVVVEAAPASTPAPMHSASTVQVRMPTRLPRGSSPPHIAPAAFIRTASEASPQLQTVLPASSGQATSDLYKQEVPVPAPAPAPVAAAKVLPVTKTVNMTSSSAEVSDDRQQLSARRVVRRSAPPTLLYPEGLETASEAPTRLPTPSRIVRPQAPSDETDELNVTRRNVEEVEPLFGESSALPTSGEGIHQANLQSKSQPAFQVSPEAAKSPQTQHRMPDAKVTVAPAATPQAGLYSAASQPLHRSSASKLPQFVAVSQLSGSSVTASAVNWCPTSPPQGVRSPGPAAAVPAGMQARFVHIQHSPGQAQPPAPVSYQQPTAAYQQPPVVVQTPAQPPVAPAPAPAAQQQQAPMQQQVPSGKPQAMEPAEDLLAAGDDPKSRNDAKCYRMYPRGGKPFVVVESIDGRKWKFDQKFVDFELACDAKSLVDWLEKIENPQFPGLLMLLAGEVTERGDDLKQVKKEYEGLRGQEDYTFFGLDGTECTDKEIDRAYRKLSTQLHPDKGGDEKAFQDMRERYDQLKAIRSEKEDRLKDGSGSISWDPRSRSSMLEAHTQLREQLIWITKEHTEVSKQVQELQRRSQLRRTLLWG